jgi:hypothetical protein
LPEVGSERRSSVAGPIELEIEQSVLGVDILGLWQVGYEVQPLVICVDGHALVDLIFLNIA